MMFTCVIMQLVTALNKEVIFVMLFGFCVSLTGWVFGRLHQLIMEHLLYNPRRQSESNTSETDIQQQQPELLSAHVCTAVSSSTTEQVNTVFLDCDRATFALKINLFDDLISNDSDNDSFL